MYLEYYKRLITLITQFYIIIFITSGCNNYNTKNFAIDTNMAFDKITSNQQLAIPYSYLIGNKLTNYIKNAKNSGFISIQNDSNPPSKLRLTLGKIFFNSLLVSIEDNNYHDQYKARQSIIDCFHQEEIAPWKMVTKELHGRNRIVFYLSCLQPYVAYSANQHSSISNVNNKSIYDEGKAPVVEVFNQNQTGIVDGWIKMNIDHLLRTPDILIELPHTLHTEKTNVLDKFIYYGTHTDHGDNKYYWKNRGKDSIMNKCGYCNTSYLSVHTPSYHNCNEKINNSFKWDILYKDLYQAP